MMGLVVTGAIIAPFLGIGGVTLAKGYKKKRRNTADMENYKNHFPDAYWRGTELYPVSQILLKVTEPNYEFESWMGDIKRYEGNFIESSEVKDAFWLNLMLVNEKFRVYRKNEDDAERYYHYDSKSYRQNFRKQQDALVQDIIDRCHDCYELMKLDSVAERQERMALSGEVPPLQLEAPEPLFVASEEKALLNILDSPVASLEMKLEATELLDKWRALHPKESKPSGEEENMRIDLLTIRNILRGKEVNLDEAPVLNDESGQ